MHPYSQSLTRIAATLALSSLAFGASAATDYSEGWNAGSVAGWGANTIDSTVVQIGGGGNPDGYLATRGPAPGTFPIITRCPDQFHRPNRAAQGVRLCPRCF